ncbi:MAG: HAD family hydrolase, partial [Armatimonadota bacterium]
KDAGAPTDLLKKMPFPYTAIFFDLDDTLCDDAGASRRAVARTCRQLGDVHPALRALPLESTYIEASTALWTTDPVKLGEPVRTMRLQAWTTALEHIGADAALAEPAVALYAAARRETYLLYPEVIPLLRSLREDYHLGLITNGPADLQREKITVMKLANEFDQLVIAGEVGCSKPDPAIFLRALQHAGCQPTAALMIGDSWEKDILAARHLGMDALWICPGAPPEVNVLPHIREIPGWIASHSAQVGA